jgi:HEPN domain-containing protein
MNDVVREWLAKAEADLATAIRELAVTTNPNFDAICFHAQQCAEKALKALLIGRNISSPRTHDLVFLARLLHTTVPTFEWPEDELRFLSRAAVEYRYPGENAVVDDAVISVRIGTGVIGAVKAEFDREANEHEKDGA